MAPFGYNVTNYSCFLVALFVLSVVGHILVQHTLPPTVCITEHVSDEPNVAHHLGFFVCFPPFFLIFPLKFKIFLSKMSWLRQRHARNIFQNITRRINQTCLLVFSGRMWLISDVIAPLSDIRKINQLILQLQTLGPV